MFICACHDQEDPHLSCILHRGHDNALPWQNAKLKQFLAALADLPPIAYSKRQLGCYLSGDKHD